MTCDGVDDNCNGGIDEGYEASPLECGLGACRRAGVMQCIDGGELESWEPGEPAPEDATCDGVDDDYKPVSTRCERAGCIAVDATSCSAGEVLDSCPSAGRCVGEAACGDGLDNDGDGRVDCLDSDCSSSAACAP